MIPKIGLVADEAADLPGEIREKYQIENVIYPVTFAGEDKETDLRGEGFYRKMKDRGLFATTSFPSPIRFKRAYQRSLEKFEKVLVIVISSTFSGAFNSAISAKAQLSEGDQQRIEIFDSSLATAAEGLLALKAQQLINEGKEPPEILEELNRFKSEVKLIGFLNNVKWLEAGGRISSKRAKITRFLIRVRARPMLGIKEGKVAGAGFNFFSKDITEALLREAKKVMKKTNKIKIVINYTDNKSDALELKEKIKNLGSDVLYVAEASPVIGAHAGPGAMVIAFCPAGKLKVVD